MNPAPELLTLAPDRWYAWEMWPGYGAMPYRSPVLVYEVKPLKTGRNELELQFHNARYAQGVQTFCLRLRVLHRGPYYMIAQILYDPKDDPDRCAVISPISLGWLNYHFSDFIKQHPDLKSMEDEELHIALTELL
ncbi:hypothetical protein GF356_07200 [candidate division GN15 bacterium]|nr:hypothetical protein [candidate division GN15 bacterium]